MCCLVERTDTIQGELQTKEKEVCGGFNEGTSVDHRKKQICWALHYNGGRVNEMAHSEVERFTTVGEETFFLGSKKVELQI